MGQALYLCELISFSQPHKVSAVIALILQIGKPRHQQLMSMTYSKLVLEQRLELLSYHSCLPPPHSVYGVTQLDTTEAT